MKLNDARLKIWPVLLLLAAAAVVPAACVLWFMGEAMDNARLAVRQRLTDVYQQQLASVQNRLDGHWAAKMAAIDDAGTTSLDTPPAEVFKRLVAGGAVDSAVLYDASGKLVYPILLDREPPEPAEVSPAWHAAAGLEQTGALGDAASAYGNLAAAENDVDRKAQALQSQARCLARDGKDSEAARILGDTLATAEFASARDVHGRWIAPDALLGALQLTPDDQTERRRALADDLQRRLEDYAGPAMPSPQRMFLMSAFQEETGRAVAMLDAERLAAQYLDSERPTPPAGQLTREEPGCPWSLATADGRVVGLFSDASVKAAVASVSPDPASLAGAEVVVVETVDDRDNTPFLSVPAGHFMPDWRLELFLDEPDPFAQAVAARNAAYRWTAGLGIAVFGLLAAAVALYLARQLRLTRLKNDLIATVSHELKTPLASMRVLVDTLREGRTSGDRQTAEYFELIARENQRLTHLIDNFLSFSRMERNKQAIQFAEIDVGEVVRAAARGFERRFAEVTPPGCRFNVDVPGGLPKILADRDAIATVLVNLLDNAWKYTGEQKEIGVRCAAENGSVAIEVSDNGVGLSRRAVRHIFDKFYQVDTTLSRRAGGCGMGLAIVRFILDAHGATIDVASEPGQGSTFTVRLPAVEQVVEE